MGIACYDCDSGGLLRRLLVVCGVCCVFVGGSMFVVVTLIVLFTLVLFAMSVCWEFVVCVDICGVMVYAV